MIPIISYTCYTASSRSVLQDADERILGIEHVECCCSGTTLTAHVCNRPVTTEDEEREGRGEGNRKRNERAKGGGRGRGREEGGGGSTT